DVFCVNLYFFFQAEDGIRDRNVTGVQTCALPISHGCDRHPAFPAPSAREGGTKSKARTNMSRECGCVTPRRCNTFSVVPAKAGRSEERRVGKEGGMRKGRHIEKKRQNGTKRATW